MATPRLNRIIDEFARRIGDLATYTGTVLNAGEILDEIEFVAYANKALQKYFRINFDQIFQADKDHAIRNFCIAFPELLVSKTENASNNDYHLLANPLLDIFHLVDAMKGSTYIKRWESSAYNLVKAGLYPITPTSSAPVAIHLQGNIYFFPTGVVAQGNAVTYNYIKLPVAPDGSFLTQNGNNDSPFYDIHNSAIAEIAEELYKMDRQGRK